MLIEEQEQFCVSPEMELCEAKSFCFDDDDDDVPNHHVKRTIHRGSCQQLSGEGGSPPHAPQDTCSTGRCERHRARRDAQHPGPAPFPREGYRMRHEGKHFSCACLGHLPHEVSCFIAQPASSFDGHHHQPRAPRRHELWVLRFLVSSCVVQRDSVHIDGLWVRLSVFAHDTTEVMSKHGKSWANTTMRRLSAARTLTFISRRYALNLARAPASVRPALSSLIFDLPFSLCVRHADSIFPRNSCMK